MDVNILIIIGFFVILLVWSILAIVTKRKTIKRIWMLLLCLQLISGTVITVYGLWITKDEELPMYVEDASYDVDDYDVFIMSEQQESTIEAYGPLAAFSIVYGGEELADRMETWYFVDSLTVVSFLNGTLMSIETDETLEEARGKITDYQPNDYVYGISPGTALGVADIDEFLIMPMGDELVEESCLYYGEDIVFGFIEDELVYAEVLLIED